MTTPNSTQFKLNPPGRPCALVGLRSVRLGLKTSEEGRPVGVAWPTVAQNRPVLASMAPAAPYPATGASMRYSGHPDATIDTRRSRVSPGRRCHQATTGHHIPPNWPTLLSGL